MEKNEIIDFIRENLSIKIEQESSYDYENVYRIIRVSLILTDEEIASDSFSVSDR